MTNKEKYADWVKTQDHLPVFMQPWWMDAVCAGKEWDVIIVEREKTAALKEESNQMSDVSGQQANESVASDSRQVDDTVMSYAGTEQEPSRNRAETEQEPSRNRAETEQEPSRNRAETEQKPMSAVEKQQTATDVQRTDVQCTKENESIVAAMPYLSRKKWWMKWILMPQQTQIGGLWLDEKHEFTPEELTAVCEEVTKQLAEKKLHYYYQHFPVSSPCPEIFKSLGFKVKERVTYRLDDLSDLDKVIDKFSRNKKRQLQKALSLHATKDLTAEEFYAFHQKCLEQQRKTISYSREFFLVLERKSSRKKQSEIIAIRTADGDLRAAGYIVWDKDYAHYLIAAEDLEYKNNGAMALLVLECIKEARRQGVAFDFEGSMIRGVAQHFKQFGGTPAKYYSVEKYYKWWFRFAIWFNFVATWKKR